MIKKLKKSLVIWFQTNAKILKWLSYLFNVAALTFLALWLIKPDVELAGNGIDFEAFLPFLQL